MASKPAQAGLFDSGSPKATARQDAALYALQEKYPDWTWKFSRWGARLYIIGKKPMAYSVKYRVFADGHLTEVKDRFSPY